MTNLFKVSGFPVLWLFLFFLASSGSGPVLGDTLTGEVRGQVVDVDGNVPLVSVKVVLTNVDRGWTREATTDRFGAYAFLQLEPGNYSLQTSNEGYYPQEKTGILIRLNRPKVVVPPFQLRKEVATPTQQVTLRGEETKTAIIDLTAQGPNPLVLAYVSEPGQTSLLAVLDWAIRANFDGTILGKLPFRESRTFDQVALLAPGVFRVPFSSGRGPAVGIDVGTAGQFSVNGMRGRSNNFTVDGSDNNDEDIGVRRQGFVALTPQSIESVQELQIVTAGFPAEFGRNAGAMVNAVSKSGTSRHRGTLYGLFADDSLSASGPFEKSFQDSVNRSELNGGGFSGPDFDRQILGGVLGGPLVPERLFYFASAEGQWAEGRHVGHFVVPRPEERGLRIRDGFVPIEDLGGFLADRFIPYSSLAGEGVYSLYPVPNNPGGPFSDWTYSQVRQRESKAGIFSGKLDWYLNPVHSLAGRYNFTQDSTVLPFTSGAFDSAIGTRTRTQNLSLFLNSSSAQKGNALRVSYGRTALDFPAERGDALIFGSPALAEIPPELAQLPSLGEVFRTPYGQFGPFGVTGPIGQAEITPYSPRGIDVFNFPQGRVDNTYQLSDFFTLTREKHTLKFGFEVRWSQLNSFSDRNSRPLVRFGAGRVATSCQQNPFCLFATEDGLLLGTDLAALGSAAGFLHTIATPSIPDSTIGLRQTQFDLFVQDNWRLAESLHLDWGLRYELQTAPKEQNRRIENTFGARPEDFPHLEPEGSPQDQAIINASNYFFDTALLAYQEFLGDRDTIYDPDRNNFAPRIGIAWSPGGSTRWVIRAGYSISFDANLGTVVSQSRNVFPTFVPLNLNPNFVSTFGYVLSHPVFLSFLPTGDPIIKPGTINSFGFPDEAFATGVGSLFASTTVPGFLPNGLAFTLPERDLENSYAQHFVASVQKQWGRDWLTTFEYVRTRGLHLTRFSTPNAGIMTTPILFSSPRLPIQIADLPPGIPAGSGRRPYGGLGAFTLFSNSANSDYNSLQVGVEKNLSQGLQFRANWTWAHAIDEVSDPFDTRGANAFPQDSTRFDLERGSASFDSRHRLAFFAIWEPEFTEQALLRNWQFSFIGEFQSGQPFTVNSSIDTNLDGNLTDRLDSIEGIMVRPGTARGLQLQPSVTPADLLAPLLEVGKVGRNSFRSDSFASVDVAVQRSFSMAEDVSLRFRVEVFNLFDQESYGVPVRVIQSPGFGRSFDTQQNPLSLRLGFALDF